MIERKKKTFKAREADVKRGWAKYCSKSCKAKYQAKHIFPYRDLDYEVDYPNPEYQDNEF